MKIIRRIFSRKPKPEKAVLDKIKALKKEKPNNSNYHSLGGNWISKEAGSYHITYNQKGKIMSLFDLRKSEKRKEINPKEYKDLLLKSIKNSRNLGCEMIVIKTWVFVKYPELKELGFTEIKPGSEANFSEFISKRKITEEKLLSNPESSRYPTYYLKL